MEQRIRIRAEGCDESMQSKREADRATMQPGKGTDVETMQQVVGVATMQRTAAVETMQATVNVEIMQAAADVEKMQAARDTNVRNTMQETDNGCRN